MKTPWWFLRKTPVAFLLWPVSVLYYGITRIVYNVRRIGAYKSRRPIVCIGNIFAGGVGKTPIVRAVAGQLNAPVVMRGYKKAAATCNVGDEALMLSRDGILVHTGNRKSNIRLLNAQDSDAPIVMDDGFQNPGIVKNISVLVFDEAMGRGNGFMLPAGPLREPFTAVRRADAAIVIKSDRCARRALKFPNGMPVFYAHNKTVSPYADKTRLFAFAGIGYPKKFFSALDNVVAKKSFADHYQYTDGDIEKLRAAAARRGAKLITTEKDWVRLPAAAQKEIKFARLDTVIDDDFYAWLKEKIHADAKKRG